jgi:PleD family two-component response regulator
MIKFAKKTGKHAIWHGEITDGFKKWLKDKKKNGTSNYNERVTILVSKEIKDNWENFAEKSDFNTISNLVRNAVNFYIDSEKLISQIKDINTLSHKLKEPLTAIRGFSQLLIENYANKLDIDIVIKLKEIFNQSKNLDSQINEIFSKMIDKEQKYDILIVEDDISTLKVLLEHFKLNGKKCIGFKSGSKCLEELKYLYPKLILIDVILPDIDGFELCKIIKLDKKLKDIPVFYVTAIPDTEVSKKTRETGAEGYILKPFDLSEFDMLEKYL